MNPPLRTARDREALIEGLVDGTLEILCSDHAPHCDYEKEVEFDYAPFGIVGFETELPLSLMQLYHSGKLSLLEVVKKFTLGPAQLLKLPGGKLAEGEPADITIFDPDQEWQFLKREAASKSKNSPFDQWWLKGQVQKTIVGGKVVFSNNH
jgi:dihydroorotase